MRRNAILAAAGAAILFVAATTYRLERAGAFYDELHQATGAFSYIGRPTTMFSFAHVLGVPLLNMSYTGAIKTAIYGVYLRASGNAFSLASWRLLGIVFSASALIAFAVLAGDRLPLPSLLLFLGLLVTDVNLLLQSRHDWGPAALGFLLRMILLGVALRHLAGARFRAGSFLLGFIVGISIFEKLSSAVLLLPLCLLVLAASGTRARAVRETVEAAAGLVLGASPAIAINVYSLITSSKLMALTAVDQTPRRSMLGYAANYLVLGNGGIERRMIFETPSYRSVEMLEGLAVAGLLLIAGIVAWTRGRADARARLAGLMLACYVLIGVVLPLLPHGTAEHHWIIGTPFQYLAIALAAGALWPATTGSKIERALFAACLTLLLACRVPAIVSAAAAVHGDRYTRGWDPSLNRAAEFAAAQPAPAIVLATNWGIAAQVFCFANGRQNFVFEPFWNYHGRATLNPILAPDERQFVVAAAVRPAAPLRPGEINTLRQITTAIFRDLASAPGWEEVPVDPAIAALRSVEIRTFRRTIPPLR